MSADGIKFILDNPDEYPTKTPLKPSDIAVLCRSHDDCETVANALENIEIRSSTARGILVRTPVCRLVLSAMRYIADKKDTLAMVELINFLPNSDDSKDWLFKLVSGKKDKSNDCLDKLETNPIFNNLNKNRYDSRKWTPLEVMEYAIEATGAIEAAERWSLTPLSLANLDKLRQTCVEYLNLCEARRESGSLTGYFSYLSEKNEKEAEGSDAEAVQVLTYHAAKGLEWPVVILHSLEADPDKKASAI